MVESVFKAFIFIFVFFGCVSCTTSDITSLSDEAEKTSREKEFSDRITRLEEQASVADNRLNELGRRQSGLENNDIQAQRERKQLSDQINEQNRTVSKIKRRLNSVERVTDRIDTDHFPKGCILRLHSTGPEEDCSGTGS